MALNFPASPSNGDTYAAPNGVLYTYDAAAGLWYVGAAGSINTSDIVDNAVTTAKINDGAVTGAKLASDIAITTTGDISAGNIVLPDDGGITFGTTMGAAGGGGTSKVLDDYEEGTFTPVFRGETTAGTYTGTFNGYYTKIGNRVSIDIQMSNITAVSAGSGGVEIAGLPFVCANGGAGATGTIRYDSWNVNDSADGLVPLVSNNSDWLQIFEVGDDRGDSGTNVGDITNGATDIFISIVYRV